MGKRLAFFFISCALGLSSYLLYPTVYWYFLLDPADKALLSQSQEKINADLQLKDSYIFELQNLILSKNHRIYNNDKITYLFNIKPRKALGETYVIPSITNKGLLDSIFFKNFPNQSKDSSEYESFYKLISAIHSIDAQLSKLISLRKLKNSIMQLGLDLVGGTQLTISVNKEHLVYQIKNKYKNLGIIDTQLITDIVNNSGYLDQGKITFNEAVLKKSMALSETSDLEALKSKLLVEYENEMTSSLASLLDNAMLIIQNRIDKFGISEIKVKKTVSSRILIEIPGSERKEIEHKIQEVIQAGLLTFHLVDENLMASIPRKYLDSNLEYIDVKYVEKKDFYYAFKEEILKELNLEMSGDLNASSLYPIEDINEYNIKTIQGFYILKNKIEVSGENLNNLGINYDQQKGTPDVFFSIDDKKTLYFADLTEKHIGHRLAILLDGKIKSKPVISHKIMKSGRISLSSSYNPIKEAKDLLKLLKAGALPTSLHIEQIYSIGPSLGLQNIIIGVKSILIGFLLVVLFMIFYYKLFGFISVIGLCINLFILFSLLSTFQFTLTLPGIAGIILTIGMAIDANVLIFERMKEEMIVHKNRIPLLIIKNSYAKASTAIFDSNITTVLVAFILSNLGSGLIQGFGFTLMLGILCSMFTSLYLTRFIIELIMHFIQFKKIYV